jgi:hypothetical protein
LANSKLSSVLFLLKKQPCIFFYVKIVQRQSAFLLDKPLSLEKASKLSFCSLTRGFGSFSLCNRKENEQI